MEAVARERQSVDPRLDLYNESRQVGPRSMVHGEADDDREETEGLRARACQVRSPDADGDGEKSEK